MIEPRKFVRGGPEWQAQRSRGPRRASAERGPVRGQRNFWDVADDKSETETLGLRAPTPQMFVSDVWNALPLWHMGRRWTFDPFRPGSLFLVRRSHGYPDFLPLRGDRAAVASSSSLPVHDDVTTFCRKAAAVKSQLARSQIGQAGKQRRFARSFRRRDRRHVDDAARGHRAASARAPAWPDP